MLSLFCSMVILTKFPLTFIFIFIILNCFQQCLKKLLYLNSSSQRRKAKLKGLRIRNWVLSPEQDIYINYTPTTKTLEMIWKKKQKECKKKRIRKSLDTWCLLNMMWLSHSWTHITWSYLHCICTISNSTKFYHRMSNFYS